MVDLNRITVKVDWAVQESPAGDYHVYPNGEPHRLARNCDCGVELRDVMGGTPYEWESIPMVVIHQLRK